MFTRIATKKYKDKTYRSLHILESYRDEEGNPRQRMVANLGDPDQYSPADAERIIRGLKRHFGLEEEDQKQQGITQTLGLGGTYTVFKLWEQLGWTAVMEKCLDGDRFRFDVVGNIKALVANRLLDPCAKLHILEWHKSVYLPGVPAKEITYNHLLRALDFMERHKEEMEPLLARKLINMFDTEVDIVFYDLTSCYFQIDHQDAPEPPEDSVETSTLRRKGYSRDHRPDLPQVVIGLVMNKEGIPLAHHVFPGNTVDSKTLEEVVIDLKKRFRLRRCVFIGDKGLLTEENRWILKNAGFDFILSHKLRRNNDAKAVINRVEKDMKPGIEKEKKRRKKKGESFREVIDETVIDERRFVVSHNEEVARQSKKTRSRKLREAEAFAKELAGKLERQDEGEKFRGKKLTDQGALLKLHDHLRDNKLLRYTEAYLNDDGMLAWEPDEKARRWENRIDGKMILETSDENLPAAEVVRRYKELQDIERCFRTMKSSLDLQPMFHRVDRRIRAHAFLCVMALQIDRIIRNKLKAVGINTLPTRVLEKLSRIIALETDASGKRHKATTTPSLEQLTLFKALDLTKPTNRDFALESAV